MQKNKKFLQVLHFIIFFFTRHILAVGEETVLVIYCFVAISMIIIHVHEVIIEILNYKH